MPSIEQWGIIVLIRRTYAGYRNSASCTYIATACSKHCGETIIVSEAGAVVLIEQQEWEHMLETLRLIQDKTSLKALLDGHKQRDAGDVPDGVTMEEAFYDLHAEHSEERQ